MNKPSSWLGRSIEERFWSKVEKTDSCWNWTGATNGIGYGRFTVGGQQIYPHRLSFEFHNGPFDESMKILHHCDNPRCVRPDHLFIGTMKDNTQDALRKGRISSGLSHGEKIKKRQRGSINHNSKLTEKDIPEILLLHRSGLSNDQIAIRFGVTRSTIRPIVLGTGWKHAQTPS